MLRSGRFIVVNRHSFGRGGNVAQQEWRFLSYGGVGRTARAGKYSEGSIIVCDAELGSRKTRQDYWRLFEASAVEDCESAILSLLEDVTVRDGNRVKSCLLYTSDAADD